MAKWKGEAMTNSFSRRGMGLGLGLAAMVPTVSMIGSAQAQTGHESTFDRVTRTKVLRIAALPGSMPYFQKDISTGEWSGSAVSMAKDIAKIWDAKLEYIESTYGNSVLDLQSNKIDLAFALNPTPARALSIGFTLPVITHPYGCIAKKGFLPSTWDDINKPEIRVVCDLGSLHETCARRFAPKSQITALKSPDDAILFLQSGRADVNILAAMLGLSALGKNPTLGTYRLLSGPLVALPSNLGVQREPDTRFVEVINAWIIHSRMDDPGAGRRWRQAQRHSTGTVVLKAG
jgi:polar amino acid transport system substrate-binding protein